MLKEYSIFYSDCQSFKTNVAIFFQLKEVTAIARGTSSDGTTAVNLVDAASNVAGEATLNTVVNSNRDFVNSLATITDLTC